MRLLHIFSPIVARLRSSHSSASIMTTNIRLLYWDIAWFGIIFAVTSNFLTVLVARLGASPLLLSAVTAGPALVNIVWQLYATRMAERAASQHRLAVWSGLFQRAGFLLIALVPWLVPATWQAGSIVAVLLLQSFPTAVAAVSFQTLLTDLVPRERRAAVVGTRNALLNLTSMAMVAAAGVLLTILPFPLGYQIILLIGFVASLASWWCVARLRTKAAEEIAPAADLTMTAPPTALHRDGNFGRFVAAAFVLHLGMFMTAPLFPLYWVQTLRLGDGWISGFAAVLSLTSILGALVLRVISIRWRMSWILAAASAIFGLYPALTGWLTHPLAIVPIAAIGGFGSGLIGVALFQALTEVCPPAQRPRYIGVYTWLMNIAIFSGPLLGAGFADLVGVEIALLVSGGIRVLAGIIFWWQPFAAWIAPTPGVRRPLPESTTGAM